MVDKIKAAYKMAEVGPLEISLLGNEMHKTKRCSVAIAKLIQDSFDAIKF